MWAFHTHMAYCELIYY